MDTVSYNEKHNEANGEDNNDGHSDNHSDNMGAEGGTDNAEINEARARRRRNMILTLLVSQGVPMILGGDEVGNSQGGNNNAYCQDDEIGWTDWSGLKDPFLDFCRKAVAFRKAHPVLRQERFLTGETDADGRVEIAWHKPDGGFMDDDAWDDGELRVLGVYLGKSIHAADTEKVDDLFLVFNAGGDCEFTLPSVNGIEQWQRVADTGAQMPFTVHEADSSVTVYGESVAIFAPRTEEPTDQGKVSGRRRWFPFGRHQEHK
jgi:glycogen operon protein